MSFFSEITGFGQNANGEATVGSVLTDLKGALSQYIVSPLNNFGFAGFVFDIEGDSQAHLSADITDHWTEGNYAVQDHIAVRPKRFILSNYVGELVYYNNPESQTQLQQVIQKLTVVDSYLPQLTRGVEQAKNLLNGANSLSSKDIFNDAVTSGLNMWNLIENLNPPIPRQQQAYQFFKALMEQKILVSMQTPFEFVSNMAIENIVAIQSEDTRYITNFRITLKEIRITQIKNVPFSFTTVSQFIQQGQPLNAVQSSDEANGGRTQGKTADINSVVLGGGN